MQKVPNPIIKWEADGWSILVQCKTELPSPTGWSKIKWPSQIEVPRVIQILCSCRSDTASKIRHEKHGGSLSVTIP